MFAKDVYPTHKIGFICMGWQYELQASEFGRMFKT